MRNMILLAVAALAIAGCKKDGETPAAPQAETPAATEAAPADAAAPTDAAAPAAAPAGTGH